MLGNATFTSPCDNIGELEAAKWWSKEPVLDAVAKSCSGLQLISLSGDVGLLKEPIEETGDMDVAGSRLASDELDAELIERLSVTCGAVCPGGPWRYDIWSDEGACWEV
jgi:hypothetical protein